MMADRKRAAGWWLAAVAMAATLGACADGGGDPEPTPSADATKKSEIDRSRKFVADVTVTATGAAEFTWQGEQEVSLTRVGSPDISVNVLSAGFLLPEILPDRAYRFRWAFDLLSGYADQPATFTMDPQPQGQQGLQDQAFLIWMKVKDPSKDAIYEESEAEFLKHFGQMKQPCTLVIGEGERTGSLECPELSTAEGETLALKVTWEQTGPDLPSQ